MTNRLHRWVLRHWYPKPALVIFLDAPAELLYARKQETTVEYLEMSRQKILKQGKNMPNFIRVDACQPLEKVCLEVSQHIMQYDRLRGHGSSTGQD